MPEINWIAVVVAAAAAFVLGGIWYAPPVFGKVWQREAGLSDQALATRKLGLVFGGAFALSLLAAVVFAMFLGPKPSLALGLGAGFSAGLTWVAASFGINYLFEHRSFKLFAVNGGYHTLQFTLYGLIFGLIH
jgi:hypothetical protein